MTQVKADFKQAEGVRSSPAYVRLLETLCTVSDFREAGQRILPAIEEISGCEAVALRVHDRRDDYPYFAHRGFEGEFVEKESTLCRAGFDGHPMRDAEGLAVLDCMCGVVVRGQTDAGQGYFSQGGSFWTNSTTEMLGGSDSDAPDTQTRNMCNAWGYESVALVPVRTEGQILGILQANSRERGRFTPALIEKLEGIGRCVGAAVETAWQRQELSRQTHDLQERQRRAETMIAMGEMASTLAHEVKNPLAGMMLSATRLRKILKGREDLEKILHHLCASIGTLSETVTRVVDSIRKPSLRREPVDVNDIVESALGLIAPRAAEQDVVIVRELAAGLAPVLADDNFLQRGFINLLLNALDAMPSSGRLTVRSRGLPEGRIEVVFADTGPGVDPNEVERLFDTLTTTKPQGAGLGLGIVRRIAELHAGSVDLRPGPDGGTEAVVNLPAATA